MKRTSMLAALVVAVLGVGSWVVGQPGQPSNNGGALVANTIIPIGGLQMNRRLLSVNTSPSIGSGFGTSASIASNNGTATFRVNVGTGGTASSGVIGLPQASNGWNCLSQDSTSNNVTRQTAGTTTSVTLTAASAWTTSDVLIVSCLGF